MLKEKNYKLLKKANKSSPSYTIATLVDFEPEYPELPGFRRSGDETKIVEAVLKTNFIFLLNRKAFITHAAKGFVLNCHDLTASNLTFFCSIRNSFQDKTNGEKRSLKSAKLLFKSDNSGR